MFQQNTALDYAPVPSSGIDPEGPPFSCLLCEQTYPHKAKLIFHYVVNHRLRFCGECSIILKEPNRMTHENNKHWPFECKERKCHAEFFSASQLKQHYCQEHSVKTCDFCKTILDMKKNPDTYKIHLRAQHEISESGLDAVGSGSLFRVIDCPEGQKRITKFHCLLCGQDKHFSNFQGHFLANHKLILPRFLEITDLFIESNLNLLDRIGQDDCVKKESAAVSLKADVARSLKANFEMKRKEELTVAERVEDIRIDFDSSIVQCIASTDEDEESESEESNGSQQRQYACPYCEGDAVGHSGMGRHLRDSHGFKVRNFEPRCNLCRKVFANRLALLRHNRKAHPLVRRNIADTIQCPFCGDAEDGREKIRQHIREHIDRSAFACKSDRLGFCCRFCPERFWTVTLKNAHQMSRHSRQMTNQDYLMCRQCGETMSSKTCLRVHTADAHPAFTQIGKLVFKCDVCLIAHSTLDDCRDHMLLAHPNQMASYCYLNDCRSKLETNQSLEDHLRLRHPKMFDFHCNLCGSVFASQQGCIKHARMKHADLAIEEES